MKNFIILIPILLIQLSTYSQKSRARDIGIPFDGTPGKFNAITDVKGVEVGYSTIISGEGKNIRGKGPVRTGVTAILPRGKNNNPVYANWYTLNGNGEMTGTTWLTESGFLEGPVMITNTNSVGTVRDAVLKWYVKTGWYKEDFWYTYPVVAETYDGFLNDIYGFHVKETNAWEALDSAKSGFIKEGNVLETVTTEEEPILAVQTGRGSQVRRAKFKIAKMVEVMGWKAVGAKLIDFSKSIEMEWEKKENKTAQGELFR